MRYLLYPIRLQTLAERLLSLFLGAAKSKLRGALFSVQRLTRHLFAISPSRFELQIR